LRNLLALSLILTLNFQVFSQMGIFAWFVLNSDYVARVLCENKNRPELHCNGQCILARKLKAAEEKERHEMADLLKVKEIQLFNPESFFIYFSNVSLIISEKLNCFYLFKNYNSPQFPVFQPPRNRHFSPRFCLTSN
jgi:hypothetical protein